MQPRTLQKQQLKFIPSPYCSDVVTSTFLVSNILKFMTNIYILKGFDLNPFKLLYLPFLYILRFYIENSEHRIKYLI